MLNKLRKSTYFVVGILLGVSIAIGHSVYALKDSQDIPFEDLQSFTEVFSRIKSDYVESVDDKTLIEDAIRGMLSGLDPHSSYLNTREFGDLKIGTTGQFGGLGIEVGMENGFVKVISPIDDTPAARAGIKALDLIMILHADHEQNASTSTVRLAGSSDANPFAAVASGIAALWGPAHGGANEAVVRMLIDINTSGKPLQAFVDRAKDKNDSFRLMGFGHRVYKNYDPRAKLIREICHQLLNDMEATGEQQKLLETAMALEKVALEDEYFVQRNLYPNVDFYSGIIFLAMGIPMNMFTVIFAMARTIGWISQWNEMMTDSEKKIGRPRQLYNGAIDLDYVPIEKR